MAGEFPPAPEWLPAVNEDALTRDDARALASAINGVAEAVGRINDRLTTIEKGGASSSTLSKVESLQVNCDCGRLLFSAAGGDYDRMDWHTIGKGIMVHMVEHLDGFGGYTYNQFGFRVTAYRKQERR